MVTTPRMVSPMSTIEAADVAWDLEPLVGGEGAAGVDRLLAEGQERADAFAARYAGKVAETAGTRTLFREPRHRYTEALFEALPERAAGTGEKLYSIPGLPPDLVSPPPACRFAPRCRFAIDRCRTEVPQLEPTPVTPLEFTEPAPEPEPAAELGLELEPAQATLERRRAELDALTRQDPRRTAELLRALIDDRQDA